MVYTIFGVLSLKVPQILFLGSFVFALQVGLLGNYFLAMGEDRSTLWLVISVSLVLIETLLLAFIADTRPI
jgi:hypothetical protein